LLLEETVAESRTVRLPRGAGTERWWDREDPSRILRPTHDARFDLADGASPGLWWTACSNPESADYHPVNFNRMRLAFIEANLDALPECPAGERRLSARTNS
jgi:hypothetical protein